MKPKQPTKKPVKRRAGRAKINIDWKIVDKYLQAQCDGVAIAGILGIHPETLYDRCKEAFKTDFSAYAAAKRGEGRELLRAKQFQSAMAGDKTMLVWLGKQYLDQKERSEVRNENVPSKETYKQLFEEAMRTPEEKDGDNMDVEPGNNP